MGSSKSSLQQLQPKEKSQRHGASVDELPINEDCSTGEMSPSSLSSPNHSNLSDALCEFTGRLNIADKQCNEGIDSPSDLPNWEILLEERHPAFDVICSHLRTDGDCVDLLNFSMVNFPVRCAVMEVMSRENYRAQLHHVDMKNRVDVLTVEIAFHKSNRPFHDLENLDWERFERNFSGELPTLTVRVSGEDDPIVEQVVCLLSTSIKWVKYEDDDGSTKNLSLADQLLRRSTILEMNFVEQDINDSTAPLVLSIASRVKQIIEIFPPEEPRLADPAAFITQLDSLPISRYILYKLSDFNSPVFFGVRISFWEKHFNQKFNSGTLSEVLAGEEPSVFRPTAIQKKISAAPVDLAVLVDQEQVLEWVKPKAM